VLARDREYVLSMLSQLEAVFMNNRVSAIRNRTAPCNGQRMHECTSFLGLRQPWRVFHQRNGWQHATPTLYVAAINHLHDVIYRGRGCSSTWKRI